MASAVVIALLILLVIAALVFLFIFLQNHRRDTSPSNSEIEAALNQFQLFAPFSTPPTPNPTAGIRAQCNVYTFSNTGIRYDAATVNTLQPQQLRGCIDDDQIYAQEVVHTCQSGSSTNSFCLGLNGERFSPGQTETYYDSTNCTASPCTSTLSLIALNFNPQNTTVNPLCVSFDGTPEGGVTLQTCNPSDSNQIFRVTRANPPSLTATNSGVLAAFMDRRTGLCLLPNSSGFVVGTSCNPTSTTTAATNGLNWYLAPPSTTAPQQIIFVSDPRTAPALPDLPPFIAAGVQVMTPADPDPQAGDAVNLRGYASSTNPSDIFASSAQVIDKTLFPIIFSAPTTLFPLVPIQPDT